QAAAAEADIPGEEAHPPEPPKSRARAGCLQVPPLRIAHRPLRRPHLPGEQRRPHRDGEPPDALPAVQLEEGGEHPRLMSRKYRNRPTRDYTVLRNAALRNPALSLKAKGALALMLTFPDDWEYHLDH